MATTDWKLKYSPRAWQVAAMERWRGERRGVVAVVTGGGKTVFAEACLKDFFDAQPDGQAIIIVPTTALLDQWVVALQDELNVAPDDISIIASGEKRRPEAPITVAVVNTARRLAGNWSKPGRPRMLIVDECHRVGSEQNAKALIGEYQATLGLSATPDRQYDDGFDRYIRPALGEIIYHYDYKEASHDGVITPFRLENVRVNLLADEQEHYDALSKRIRAAAAREASGGGGEPSDALKVLLRKRATVSATAITRIPFAVRLVENHRGERTIVFHERADAADRIYALLAARGHSVALYHSGIGPALRRENLRLFRRGVYDVLVCCRALDEGMNVPETSVAVIASSTASVRQRIQRLGRILRPAKGKDDATVYTLYATDEEKGRLEAESLDLREIAQTTWHEGRIGVG